MSTNEDILFSRSCASQLWINRCSCLLWWHRAAMYGCHFAHSSLLGILRFVVCVKQRRKFFGQFHHFLNRFRIVALFPYKSVFSYWCTGQCLVQLYRIEYTIWNKLLYVIQWFALQFCRLWSARFEFEFLAVAFSYVLIPCVSTASASCSLVFLLCTA